jgi:hypothetical protein
MKSVTIYANVSVYAYLVTDFIKLDVPNLVRRPLANPSVIEIVVVQGHNALYTRPFFGARYNAKTSILWHGGNVGVYGTDAVCWGEPFARGLVRNGCKVAGRQAIEEVRVSAMV